MEKWDKRFLELAEFVSKWSKDPSTQVGAVITNGKRLVSIGFNGLAQGISDTKDRLGNRDRKIKTIIHAEKNACIFAMRDVGGFTIYTWPFMPCGQCSSYLIQVGIKRVVAPYAEVDRWMEDFKLASEQFGEAGVWLDLVGGPAYGYLA